MQFTPSVRRSAVVALWLIALTGLVCVKARPLRAGSGERVITVVEPSGGVGQDAPNSRVVKRDDTVNCAACLRYLEGRAKLNRQANARIVAANRQ